MPEITMTGSGTVGDIVSWSVKEDATPPNVATSTGSTGTASIEARTRPDSQFVGKNDVTLTTSRGVWSGVARTPSVKRGTTTIEVDGLTRIFDTDKTAGPRSSFPSGVSLSSVIYYYCGLAGFPANRIDVDPIIANTRVNFPGWTGNLWVKLKELASVYLLEIAVSGNRIVFRPRATNSVDLANYDAIAWDIDSGNYARTFNIVKYDNRPVANDIVYPAQVDPKNATVIQVDRDEVWRQRVTLNHSLITVNQPFPVDTIGFPYVGTTGAYTILGNDNLPVSAARWRDYGGKVTVALTENPYEVEITVNGPNTSVNAPFRIAETDGDNVFNTLYITGSGVKTEKETLEFPTGAEESETGRDVGVTIDCPFLSDAGKVFTAAFACSSQYGLPQSSISTGTMRTSADSVALGKLGGATIPRPGVNYRADSNTITTGALRIKASRYVTDDDLRAVWGGKTDNQFRATWTGYSNADMAVQPLRT